MKHRRALQVLGAVISWGSLALLYSTIYHDDTGRKLAFSTVQFFSYFTMLSNLMAALVFTFPSRFGPVARGAVALYIVITCLVYFLLLRGQWEPQGIQWFTDITMHYIIPPLYLYNWVRAPHSSQLRWRHAVYWLSFPLAYALYTLAHGAVTGFYPYYFLDVSQFGYPRVVENMGVLTLAFLVVGGILIAIDRKHRAS